MTKQALIEEHKTVKATWSKLTVSNLHSFHNDFINLYDNIISEYSGDKEHSNFYHTRKIIEKMGNFNSVAKKNQEGEFSEIRGAAGAALRDLELLILKMA